MRLPSNSPISPGYGFGSILPPYSIANPHNGVDFLHKPDDIIYAPFSGRVAHGYNDRDGNGSYMTDPQDRFHGLLHASKYLVANGASVVEGQPIAVMGDTGFAQGVHLHWCVKENGAFIDPMSLISNSAKEETMPDSGTVQNFVHDLTGNDATQTQKDVYTKKDINAPDGLYYGYAQIEIKRLQNTIKELQSSDANQKLEQIKQIVG